MKLFAKRQSNEPIIPPELKPYYGKSRGLVGLGRHSRVLLAVLFVIVLLAIAGVVWVLSHRTASPSTSTNGLNSSASQSPQSTKHVEQNTGTPAKTPSSGVTNTPPVPVN